MEEILGSDAEDTGSPGAAVILEVAAEVLEGTVLPEVDTAFNLEIASVDCAGQTVLTLGGGGVVVVDEEEGVTELVTLEHLEGGGHVIAVLSEIVEGLDVGLGKGSLSQCKCR